MEHTRSPRTQANHNGFTAAQQQEALAPLHRYLEQLSSQQFFGKVIVSYQNGKVHDIKVEQTHKLHDL